MRFFDAKSSRAPVALIVFVGICLLIFSTASLALATGTITGKVTDKKTGEPLPGANIVVKGTKFGAATDPDGAYTIPNLQAGTYTLVVSYVGYRSQTFDVQVRDNEQSAVSFVMREDILSLDEVVVTGISSRTSKEVAEVAVSRVAASSLTQDNSYQTVTQLIEGKVAGVNIAPTSGNAGSGYRFNVRSGGGLKGDEQPVIYIDGVRVDNSQVVGFGVGGQGTSVLASLNPNDIDKIEFLKGPAAAASYGTSGANGVVLISTKRGKLQPGQGSGIAIDYKVFGGTNRQSYDYKASDFVSAADANSIFRDGDILQQTINASGGSERLKYFASYDNRHEQGITRNNSLDRKNVRANIDAFPNEKLTLRLSTGYTLNKILRPNNDNNILGYLGNVLLSPVSYLFTDSASIEAFRDQTNSNRFIGSASAEYTPFRGLYGRLTVGIDDDSRRQDQNYPLNYTYGVSQYDQGDRRIYNRRNTQYTYTLDGRYEYKILQKLSATSLVGAQLLNRRFNTSFIEKYNFNTELITNIGAGGVLSQADEAFENRREAGIFTEHSFNYADQYFFTLGIRRDYASVIGKQAPSINYPKASAAVRLDRYNFFPSMFSLMKVRAAYGETGILPDLLDGIPLLWQAEQGGFGAGAVLATIGNDAIKPERVKELELGFEAELLENYGVEFTYYMQRINDSIINFRNSPSTGKIASAVPFNIGKIDGSGVEVLLRATPLRSRNFGVDLTVIANHQNNEVKSLGGAQPIFDGFDVNVIKEGLSKHEFYTQTVTGVNYAANGFYSSPKLTADRVALGNPVPKNTGSFSLNLRFLKNFNLYALADWATEQKMYNDTELFSRIYGNDPEFNRLATQLGLAGDRNKAGGVARRSTPVAGVTALTPGTPEYQAAAERFARLDHRVDGNFIEDADYLKLREVSLSYTFKDLLPKFFAGNYLKAVTLGVSGSNLWTTTKYSGADVELNFAGARSLSRGQDFLTLMQPRSYNVFLNFSL